MDELNRVSSKTSWYHHQQTHFDRELIRFRYLSLASSLVGQSCLELGPSNGFMTRFLVERFQQVTIVEGAQDLLDVIPDHLHLEKVHSLFEEYQPSKKFDSIMMQQILEHVVDPVHLLSLALSWLAPQGKLFLGVPNARSFHRLVAVKMGLLRNVTDLNDRDIEVGHRRVYTWESLGADIQSAGLCLEKMDGVFFKPLSNAQIEKSWDQRMIEGFYLLGKDFPENAAEIIAIVHA